MNSAIVAAATLLAVAAGTAGAAAETESAPPPTGGKAVWASDFASARSRAESDGKLVFVEFQESGCGNCSRMDALLYPAVTFEMTLLRMVPVRLDRTSGEGAALAARYEIPQSPGILVVSPGGALVFRMDGFDNAPAFYQHMQSSLASWDKLHVRMIHEPEFRDDPRAELELGADIAARYDPEEAIPRFERAAASPKADPETRDRALSGLAASNLKMRRYPEAEAAITRLLRVTANADLKEQAEIFAGRIALESGDRSAARAAWREFVRKHPKSPRLTEARTLLATIGDTKE